MLTSKPVCTVVNWRRLVGWVGNVQLGRKERKRNFCWDGGFVCGGTG